MCSTYTFDVWASFRVMMCTFFSADVGRTINCLLTTHPLQTVIKLSFVANGSESFCVHCFACWTSPEVILFSESFHLLQNPGYRVWSLASHTKRSVSAGTWYRRLYLLPGLGKHLLVKTSMCWSSGGSVSCFCWGVRGWYILVFVHVWVAMFYGCWS